MKYGVLGAKFYPRTGDFDDEHSSVFPTGKKCVEPGGTPTGRRECRIFSSGSPTAVRHLVAFQVVIAVAPQIRRLPRGQRTASDPELREVFTEGGLNLFDTVAAWRTARWETDVTQGPRPSAREGQTRVPSRTNRPNVCRRRRGSSCVFFGRRVSAAFLVSYNNR